MSTSARRRAEGDGERASARRRSAKREQAAHAATELVSAARRGRATARAAAELVQGARRARENAHAPYSRFKVGAAVRDEHGRVHVGCNVENASYGLTICAERVAVGAAVAAGARAITGLAVVTDARPVASPCGACRQVLAELAADDAPVFLATARGEIAETVTVGALLPRAFRLHSTTNRTR